MPFLLTFDNTYANLPECFYQQVSPAPVKNPTVIAFNVALAEKLGINAHNLNTKTLAAIFAGNIIPAGAKPLALAYAGHQFGHFVPQLGDGRAILLGEIIDCHRKRWDMQLKGSGRTAYSRQGDGRAALGPMLREYLVSEAMYALGIPTTRALALVKTGETVLRDTLLPGAILTRIAASHIRVGTFEYFAAKGDLPSLKRLADYVIERHYPEVATREDPYLALFEVIRDRQAFLIAQWIRVGFIHGVMNTDNMAVSGETIDYGPCAFLDQYQADKVFSSIDYYGRYAFFEQPKVAAWNLAQLARTLMLVAAPTDGKTHQWQEALEAFSEIYQQQYLKSMGSKIGFPTLQTEDIILWENLLILMQQEQMDYTLTFQYLITVAENTPWLFPDLFVPSLRLQKWITLWQQRWNIWQISSRDIALTMRYANPAIIPRNHQIEHMIQMALNQDFSHFHKWCEILKTPYAPIQFTTQSYASPPEPHQQVRQTFCGT